MQWPAWRFRALGATHFLPERRPGRARSAVKRTVAVSLSWKVTWAPTVGLWRLAAALGPEAAARNAEGLIASADSAGFTTSGTSTATVALAAAPRVSVTVSVTT